MTLNFAPLIWENAWNTAGRDSGTVSSPVVSLEKGEKREGWWEGGKGRDLPLSSFPSPLSLLSFLKRDDWGRVRHCPWYWLNDGRHECYYAREMVREDSSIPFDRQTQLISPGKGFILVIPVEKMTLHFVTGRSPSLKSLSFSILLKR